ncbi:E3 ubiquitin-protein ligase RNF170 [Ciona intestinalis]
MENPENAEISATGTYVEGVGDEVVVAFFTFLTIFCGIGSLVYKWLKLSNLTAIHPDSQENVNATRSQLGINSDGSTTTSDISDANERDDLLAGEGHRSFYSDHRCPICLQDARCSVETNCGHLFCGQCIITYWRYGNWLGAVQCPVCRQMVSLLMRNFQRNSDNEETREVESNINEYNRRFSGQPRPLLDYLWDLPALLRHLWREFFSVGGLVMMFRARIFLCFVAVLLYVLSPLDILPEAVLGVIGFIDDFFIFLLVLVYVTIIYRQIVAERVG